MSKIILAAVFAAIFVSLGIFMGNGFQPTWLRPILSSFGISISMSVLVIIAAFLLGPHFDRTNGNDTGPIAACLSCIGIITANAVALIGAVFIGVSIGLFVLVGCILLGTLVFYLWMLSS